MPLPKPFRALVVVAAALVAASAAACADATSPKEGSSILTNGPNGSTSGPDSVRLPFDPHRYAGLIVWPSTDSLRAWSPVAGVKVELVKVDADRGTVTAVASALTDAAGRYEIQDPTKSPMGLLAVRAVPGAGSPFRPSPLALALIDVPENGRYWYLGLETKDAPARPGPVNAQAGQAIAAPEFGTTGPGVPGAIIEYQKLLEYRYLPPHYTELYEVLSPVIDYGVADADGRFYVALSQGTGWYRIRARAPAGSPYQYVERTLRTWVGEQNAQTMGDHPLVLRFRETGG